MTLPGPTPQRSSPGHPISVVAARTGLSRDVLRVWERRYKAVEPIRTAGGQRRYSDDHVERFRLLAAAIGHGRTISMVAQLETEELARLVADDAAQQASGRVAHDEPSVETVDAALRAIDALDATALDALLRRAIAHAGVASVIDVTVPALMQEVGDRWVAGKYTVAHEHFASAVVVGILMETVSAVAALPTAPRVVVATPSGEHHAMGAALAAAAASLQGWSIVYLGADVPHADISSAAVAVGARAVALSITYTADPSQTASEVRALRDALAQGVPIFVGGAAAGPIAAVDRRITLCGSLGELRTLLGQLVSAP